METVNEKKEVLQLKGGIIALASRNLRSKTQELIDQGVTHLVLDLAEVEVIDSTGIGVLIGIHNTLEAKGGTLSIIRTPDDICKMFKIMRLDRRISISSLQETGSGG